MKLKARHHSSVFSETQDVDFCMISAKDLSLFRTPYGKVCLPEASVSNTSAPSTLALAYQWYMSCWGHHKRCKRLVNATKWYPTRLLDIGVKGDLIWKLIDTSIVPLMSPNYMTLSYRWSPSPGLTLNRSTLMVFRGGMPLHNLPQTFKDTVIVAHRFSVRYLWIDSLCILQDSSEDWERESSLMRDVYTNSCCNIAAAASTDTEGGLFRDRHLEDVQPGFVRVPLFGSGDMDFYIFDESYWERQILMTPLHQRGWVFQERLLAPRVLHFTKKQVFWECFVDQKCEAFPHGVPLTLPFENLDSLFESVDLAHPKDSMLSSETLIFWARIVEHYSRCDLTIASDKLVALSGLADLFQALTGQEYIVGAWKSRLSESLDWRVYEPRAKTSSDYRAPSWSWASIDGPVVQCGISRGSVLLITVLDVQISRSNINLLGSVLGAFIVVRGLIVEASIRAGGSEGTMHRLETRGRSFPIKAYGDDVDVRFGNGAPVHCLALRCYPTIQGNSLFDLALVGLLLRRKTTSTDCFTRIGHFTLWGRDAIQKFGVAFDSSHEILSPRCSVVEHTEIRLE